MSIFSFPCVLCSDCFVRNHLLIRSWCHSVFRFISLNGSVNRKPTILVVFSSSVGNKTLEPISLSGCLRVYDFASDRRLQAPKVILMSALYHLKKTKKKCTTSQNGRYCYRVELHCFLCCGAWRWYWVIILSWPFQGLLMGVSWLANSSTFTSTWNWNFDKGALSLN